MCYSAIARYNNCKALERMSNSRNPRVNVVVTPEQHTLLLQLSRLQNRSAASFLREMLDNVTPLLRASVPLLTTAAQEIELTRAQAADILRGPMELLRETGLGGQPELPEIKPSKAAAPGTPAASGSERGRTKRRSAQRG